MIYSINLFYVFNAPDVKKVCPAEMMTTRRRVSIDSSRGMSEDSSEDEDSRNQNIANNLKSNRSSEQLTVSFLILQYYLYFYFIYLYIFFKNIVSTRNRTSSGQCPNTQAKTRTGRTSIGV